MKTKLFLIFALLLLAGSVSAQNNKASVSLTAAIYEEEVSGNLDKAVTLYLDILKKYPDDRQVAAKTLYHLGLVSEKMGQQKADEYYRQLVTNYPDQTEMATLARAKLALYKNANSESTKKAEKSFKLAADLFKQLKYGEAVAEYEKVIKLAPESGLAQESQLWIGHCYFKQGKNDLALRSFNTILKDYPKSNLVPVAELMIGQVRPVMAMEHPKSSVVVIDDKTILDTVTGIKYTKINTWAGKNDVIKSANAITDISKNHKFILSENKIIPFDNSDAFTVSDSLGFMKLSPDGNKIVCLSNKSMSVIPISPENGRPTGQAYNLLNRPIQYGLDINWSPDGNNLIFSAAGLDKKFGLWLFSINSNTLKLLKTSQYGITDLCFSKNGSNILYYIPKGGQTFDVEMKSPTIGKSVSILDSLAAGRKIFRLSPDNHWIIYDKIGIKKYIFRLEDKQKQELSIPEEVGEFVSWENEDNKSLFYKSSYEVQWTVKNISVYGGPSLEFVKKDGQFPMGWTPDGRSIIVENRENIKDFYGKRCLNKINLYDQVSKPIEGLTNYNNFSISPDYTKIMVHNFEPGKMNSIYVFPISWKDGNVSGEPISIIKDFYGLLQNYMWSPNGRKVALNISGDIWIIDVDGSNRHQLTKDRKGNTFYVWSPDGNALAIEIQSTNQLQILNTSDGKVLYTFEKAEYFDWSPDGKEIAIADENGQLYAFSMTSKSNRKIANWKDVSSGVHLYDLSWSPDGKWIGISGNRMHLIDAVDGKATELDADETRDKNGFYWSPDSKWISYYAYGPKKVRLGATLWEADLTGFMKKMKPGTEKGFTTDFDFKTIALPDGGVPPDGTFTDLRDGHEYKYKKIGTQTWMTENLAYLPEVNPDSATSLVDKRFYVYGYKGYDVKEAKNTENYQKYGVLYNWPAAMNGVTASNSGPSGVQGICPKGWHLPSDAEWMILEKNLGMSEEDLKKEGNVTRLSGIVGAKLKSLTGWEDDNIYTGQSGFNAIPGGQIYKGVGYGLNSVAWFWTSPVFNDNKVGARYVSVLPGLYRGTVVNKDGGRSIRCVKD